MTKNPLVSLSVVVPAYNAAKWLPLSIPRTIAALKESGIKNAEIIVVDDGSSDGTAKVAESLKLDYPIKVVRQKNSGRFIARRTGTTTAKYPYILFIDTRIYINVNSLKYLVSRFSEADDRVVWTSHVYIDKKGNIYARFWEALTFIAWRKYFANPRECSYGIKDFDHYPKGTTCFFAPKAAIEEANNWFEKNTKSRKDSNDDTLLIRRIAESYSINISPKFFCTYHARTSLRQYSKHVYHRGKVFVDGFLRRDGNRFFWPLVLFLLLSAAGLLFLIIKPALIPGVLLIALAIWFICLAALLALKVPAKDALSFFALTPLFIVVYGLGIWAAVLEIYIFQRTRKISG